MLGCRGGIRGRGGVGVNLARRTVAALGAALPYRNRPKNRVASRYASLVLPSALLSEILVRVNATGRPAGLARALPSALAEMGVVSSARPLMLQFPYWS